MEQTTLDGDFSAQVSDEPRFANFGQRLGAYMLDVLFTLPLYFGLMWFTLGSPNWQGYLGVMLLYALYKPVMEGLFGATLGKMVLKLKVVQHGGEQATIAQAFIRYVPWIILYTLTVWSAHDMLTYPEIVEADGFAEAMEAMQAYQLENGGYTIKSILGSAAYFLPLISTLFLLGNTRKQALHDKLGETYVVDTKPAPTY